MEIILQPWPWYVSGPLIALVMTALLYTGKKFGMSSNLQTLCSAAGAGKVTEFFNFDWKAERWNLVVILGAVLGGFMASNYLVEPDFEIGVNPAVVSVLQDYGFSAPESNYLPPNLFSWENLNAKHFLLLLGGGFLIGFGARYAGGCTSGHAISGLSNLQLPSLIAVLGFFAGGLVMVHLLFPLIF